MVRFRGSFIFDRLARCRRPSQLLSPTVAIVLLVTRLLWMVAAPAQLIYLLGRRWFAYESVVVVAGAPPLAVSPISKLCGRPAAQGQRTRAGESLVQGRTARAQVIDDYAAFVRAVFASSAPLLMLATMS